MSCVGGASITSASAGPCCQNLSPWGENHQHQLRLAAIQRSTFLWLRATLFESCVRNTWISKVPKTRAFHKTKGPKPIASDTMEAQVWKRPCWIHWRFRHIPKQKPHGSPRGSCSRISRKKTQRQTINLMGALVVAVKTIRNRTHTQKRNFTTDLKNYQRYGTAIPVI